MKPLIHIDDTQIHIDDEHYTLFIRFKQKPPEIKLPNPLEEYHKTITVIREGDRTNSLHKSIKVKPCLFCKKEFKPKHSAQLICSDECKRNHKIAYLKAYRKTNNKSDIDATLKEIEERKKKPYQVTPPVV